MTNNSSEFVEQPSKRSPRKPSIFSRTPAVTAFAGLLLLGVWISTIAVAGASAPQHGNATDENTTKAKTVEVVTLSEKGERLVTTINPEAVRYSKSGHDITRLSAEKIEELAAKLTDEEARILLRQGTEPPFCGNLLDNKKDGFYACKLCGLPLFASKAKFNSGTGWPSFFTAIDPDHVRLVRDTSHGMVRDEIVCARCGSHLGHVFADGPPPSGQRFCLNSASLNFVEEGTIVPEESQPVTTEHAYFGGGCFWGVEHYFQQQAGVIDVVSGYQGGTVENPTYREVCTGQTGHAEVVRITYDPARVSYEQLLALFFKVHDPTQLNRQGPDFGTQYRSSIFPKTDEHKKAAEKFIAAQQD